MGKRDTFKYVFKVGNKIVHGGIADDLDRRERQHQQKWRKGYQQRKHPGTEPYYNTVPMCMTSTRRRLSDISREDIVTEFTRRYKE